jgi:hypothetical protein
MRGAQVALVCLLVGCAPAQPVTLRLQPNPECTPLAERLQSMASASTVQIPWCSAEFLDVRFDFAALPDSVGLAGPSERLARRVWDAGGRRAAYVRVTVAEGAFGVVQCFGTQPWRDDPGCQTPDSLRPAERTDVRVRLWDERTGQYIRAAYSLEKPNGWTESWFLTRADSAGWSKSFWVPPGRYRIVITELPCGSEDYFLKRSLSRRFVARAGAPTDLTLRVHSGTVQMRKSHNNPAGQPCTDQMRTEGG